jgi:hypothetical protein
MCLVYMYSNPPDIWGENPPILSNPIYMCFEEFISQSATSRQVENKYYYSYYVYSSTLFLWFVLQKIFN